jgi:hydroxymethylglutaryl-CoA synthase
MRGIISAAGYVPYWRLDRAAIAAFHGAAVAAPAPWRRSTKTPPRSPSRQVDSRSRRRRTRRRPCGSPPRRPTYLEKTNATVVHAALRLDPSTLAVDAGGAVRSGIAALRNALHSADPATLVVTSDIRGGLANSPDESAGGDAGAAIVAGSGDAETLVAEYLGGASATREFLDRWRAPGDVRTKQWEERFGETQLVALGQKAWAAALANVGLDAASVDAVLVAGPHGRAVNSFLKKLGRPNAVTLGDTVGNTGTAEAALLLAAYLETAAPGQTVALIGLCDGADVLVFRTTEGVEARRPQRRIVDQIEAGNASLPYAKFLSWRGVMPINPPNRPEPARSSASAAGRSIDWKFGFVGSVDRSTGAVHMPPARVSFVGGAVDEMDPAPHGRSHGHDRHLHRRSARVFAEPARDLPQWSTSTAAVDSPLRCAT